MSLPVLRGQPSSQKNPAKTVSAASPYCTQRAYERCVVPFFAAQARHLDVGSQAAPEPALDLDLPADVVFGLGEREQEPGQRNAWR